MLSNVFMTVYCKYKGKLFPPKISLHRPHLTAGLDGHSESDRNLATKRTGAESQKSPWMQGNLPLIDTKFLLTVSFFSRISAPNIFEVSVRILRN